MRHSRQTVLCSALIAALAASAILGLVASPGCAGGSGAAADFPDGRAGWELARIAVRQDRRPSEQARQAPPPPGVDESSLAPVAPGDERARRPLGETIESLTASRSAPLEANGPDDEAARLEDPDALRLYVSGRQRRLAGETRRAIRDLEDAAELDPDAAAPWRELGEAYVDSNDRFSALAAFRRALERDPSNFRSLEMVGRTLAERRQYEEAAPLLARAWRRMDARDAALPHIIGLALGRSLHELGYLRAGNEALRVALDLPERFGEPTNYRSALADVYRAQGDAWRDVGDADVRLGQHEDALQAYKRAAAHASLDPGAITLRRVYASMRVGRPAEAALIVLTDVEASKGRVEDRDLRLIEYIVRHSDVGSAFAEGIEEVASSLDARERALAASRLARARAAAAPDRAARSILRDRLSEAPQDEEALSDLLERLRDASAEAILEETIRLVDAAPYNALEFADALRDSARSPESLLESWPDVASGLRSTSAGRMLRSALLMTLGRLDEAERVLRELLAQSPNDMPAAILLAENLESQGLVDEALARLESIKPGEDQALRLAKSRVLRSLGRPERALATLDPLLQNPSRGEVALLASNLHATLRNWGETERWRRRAIELDPSLESAYRGLIELYAQSGPLADSSRLNETIRDLRRAIPSSRTLRWLRAAEMMRSGQFDQAERDLLSLAEEDPSESVVELLVTLWLRTDATRKAEQWLRDLIDERGRRAPFVRQLARVLGAAGEAEEGVSILRDWLARRPGDTDAARLLESLLRDRLGRTREADTLALERLQRTPASARRSLEFVEIHLRRGEPIEAAEAAQDAIRLAEAPSPQQKELLVRAVLGVAAEANDGNYPIREALNLYDLAADKLDELSIEFHATRLQLLARVGADVDEMLAAASLASRQHQDRGADVYLTIVQQLINAQRLDAAAEVASRGVAAQNIDDTRLSLLWVQLAMRTLKDDMVREAIRSIVDQGRATRIVNEWYGAEFRDDKEAGADMAVQVAGFFSREGNEDTADSLYRFALSLDPRHAMANNNLGYRILETGGDLKEAARLLEIAFEESPASAAVVDSLGWLRYRQGVFEDRPDAGDEAASLGAVSLLQRAAQLSRAQAARNADASPDAVIFDHLGDALWRAGRTDEAREQWIVTRSLLETEIVRNETTSPQSRDLLQSVEEKIAAVDDGRRPPVAPTAAEKDDVERSAQAGETPDAGAESSQSQGEPF